MTKTDSRTKTALDMESPYMDIEPSGLYMTSESKRSAWGQPPISHYVFTVVDGALHGQLVSQESDVYASLSAECLFVVEPQLDLEFQAWDTLSDEALIDFEQQLD
jgi:hypothetical protein